MPNQFLNILFLITWLSYVESRIDKCENNLLKDCTCSKIYFDEKTYFNVNCTNTGFHNTTMLKKLPSQTEWLVFSGNHIPILENNLFGNAPSLDNLKIIDLTNNGIEEIQEKAFNHVIYVKRLILNHNDISISKENHHSTIFKNLINLEELHLTNAFVDNSGSFLSNDLHDIFVRSNLKNLYKLHLEQNELKSFKDESVFCDLSYLHDLYLGNNLIPYLNFNVSCLKKLRYLDLENNNISSFSGKDLDTFNKMSETGESGFTININDNPFSCDKSKNFYDWLQNTDVSVINKNSIKCTNFKYGKRYIVNLKKFIESKQAKFAKSLKVFSVVMTIVVVSLLLGLFYMNKNKIKAKYWFDAATKKVHYTSIESQDDVEV